MSIFPTSHLIITYLTVGTSHRCTDGFLEKTGPLRDNLHALQEAIGAIGVNEVWR